MLKSTTVYLLIFSFSKVYIFQQHVGHDFAKHIAKNYAQLFSI